MLHKFAENLCVFFWHYIATSLEKGDFKLIFLRIKCHVLQRWEVDHFLADTYKGCAEVFLLISRVAGFVK